MINSDFHPSLIKYPRTPHLEGSRIQPGDETINQVSLRSLAGCYVVIEEKIDGANTGVSFSSHADLLLQSRGHYLIGGARERQFNLFKRWADVHESRLFDRLEDRYIMYGEWAYNKHSVFYDHLPHYFHEFDLYDRQNGQFLSTRRRHELLAGSPVLSVPVLYAGPMPTQAALLWKLICHSLAKSAHWKTSFRNTVIRHNLPCDLCWQQTDKSDHAEGLYIKVEDEQQVRARYKLVRPDFVQTILDSGSHYASRPVLPNGLTENVDLFAPQPAVTWEMLGLRTLHSLEQLRTVSVDELEGGRP